MSWFTPAEHTSEHGLSLDELVSKLKNSIQEVDKDFVARLLSDEEESSIIGDVLRNFGSKTRDKALERLGFTSWCNFGFYDADFGWEKPMWVSPIGLTSTYVVTNMIILVDTRFNSKMDEKKMRHLELFTELLTYATLDPSPLVMGFKRSNSKL
ncbi:hypothetical protein HN51_020985 [Arachis hypogaea]